jgi:hypothetical protein
MRSHNKIIVDAVNILWGAGAHFSQSYEQILKTASPQTTIVFNMEQIALGNSFVNERYINFLSNYRVLDYNINNINALKKLAPEIYSLEFPLVPSAHFSGDYEKAGSFNPNMKRTVSFFGAQSGRRVKILEQIEKKNVSVMKVHGKYGRQLSSAIEESTICVNIHALETGIFEVARCLRPLAMGIPVVSERSQMPEIVDWGASGVMFCESEEIADLCEALISNPFRLIDSIRKTMSFMQAPGLPELARSVMEKMFERES